MVYTLASLSFISHVCCTIYLCLLLFPQLLGSHSEAIGYVHFSRVFLLVVSNI